MTYDVLIIGGGPGGIYTAWELLNKRPDLKLALFESGHTRWSAAAVPLTV